LFAPSADNTNERHKSTSSTYNNIHHTCASTLRARCDAAAVDAANTPLADIATGADAEFHCDWVRGKYGM
jgi:hypothetical protein